MHGDKVKSRLIGGFIEVENITGQLLNNCVVSLRNIFSGNLIFEKTTLRPGEIKKFPIIGPSTFRSQWEDEALNLRVYSNHSLVHKKMFKDKTKCFVVISNDKFEKIAEQLIIGLTRYSNIDILHYTIGYKSSLNYRYLQNIEFDLKGDINDQQYMQFSKPPVFLDVLNRGYKAAVFIDADVQVRSNVEDLFGYINQIEDGPVFHKSPHEFTVVHNMYIPGPLLSGLMDLGIEKQLAPQGITNVVIFNQTHRDLFEEWNTLCFSKEIEEIRKTEFLHDELLINCLMWKKGVKPKLFFLTTNVNTIKDIEFFYHHTKNYSPQTDLNEYDLGFFAQSFINYESETICGFHCVKDPEVAKKINDLIYKNEIGLSFKDEITNFYENLEVSDTRFFEEKKPIMINHYINGPYLEIKGSGDRNFNVKFLDGKLNTIYESRIGCNMWSRPSARYYDEYTTQVFENGELVYDEKINLKGKRVYISLDSSSLGDTFAWFPYAEEFRKKHGCHVVVSTFMNDLFKDQYPDLEFVAPGTNVQGIYAMYNIGWYYDDKDQPDLSRNKVDFKAIPLQMTATEILGLEYKEVKPLIKVPKVEKKKKVGLGIHSTAQAKYWNNPTGWQEVTDYLIANGYEVVIYSKEGDDYMGNKFPKGATKFPNGPIENVIEDMASCEFFIGIGSGLSWLAWAVGLPMFLISGFSEEYSEPTENVVRIINKDVCHGCFNKHRLDPGDWNWCPLHKGTERQFECTKSITGQTVIGKIKEVLSK
jgi:autotransporter strand-loop-strand O-heptosyltransferase